MLAGLIGAAGNNGLGIAGVNWSVKIMAVRIGGGDQTDLHGNSHAPFYSDMVKGLDYVLEMKRRGVNVRVVNQSVFSLVAGPAWRDAMTALDEADIVACFAAGNQNWNVDLYPTYPNAYKLPSVLNVAASTESDGFADFTSYGHSTVDFAAPGRNITSTWIGGSYRSGQFGSSFSSPLTAGAAALILSAHPELKAVEVKAALLGSVDPVPAWKGKVLTNGRQRRPCLRVSGGL